MIENRIYDIIGRISPMITEKALKASENNKVVFKTPADVTKKEIQSVFKKIYKEANILDIKSLVVKGKVKKFKGKIGKRSDFKKFYIKLDKTIDITTGIK